MSGHLLEGVKGPSLLAEAEADGFQEVPEFIGLPLGVVDPSSSLVVDSHEVVVGVARNAPRVGSTHEYLSARSGSCGHMCDS